MIFSLTCAQPSSQFDKPLQPTALPLPGWGASFSSIPLITAPSVVSVYTAFPCRTSASTYRPHGRSCNRPRR